MALDNESTFPNDESRSTNGDLRLFLEPSIPFVGTTLYPIYLPTYSCNILLFSGVNYTSIQSDNICFQSHYKVSQFSVSLAWRDRMLAEIAILHSTLMTLGSYGILESALLSTMCRTHTVLLSTMCVCVETLT